MKKTKKKTSEMVKENRILSGEYDKKTERQNHALLISFFIIIIIDSLLLIIIIMRGSSSSRAFCCINSRSESLKNGAYETKEPKT